MVYAVALVADKFSHFVVFAQMPSRVKKTRLRVKITQRRVKKMQARVKTMRSRVKTMSKNQTTPFIFTFAPMIAELSGKKVDLSNPIDISIPLKEGKTVNAYFAPSMKIEPVRMGDWIGEVKKGAPVNYRNIFFNPHGNGTHTECVGHISKENFSINQCLKEFFFLAELISVKPQKIKNDLVITKFQISNFKFQISDKNAVIIRTLPNSKSKLTKNYSGKNPPYIKHEAVSYLVSLGIEHILVDLPSLDKEEDGGKLLAHKAFWNYPENPKTHRTITELIYVPNKIPDGTYLLNLQIASFETDAVPSKPVLYRIF